jgi:hypothetical protein
LARIWAAVAGMGRSSARVGVIPLPSDIFLGDWASETVFLEETKRIVEIEPPRRQEDEERGKRKGEERGQEIREGQPFLEKHLCCHSLIKDLSLFLFPLFILLASWRFNFPDFLRFAFPQARP